MNKITGHNRGHLGAQSIPENPLGLSWHDSTWIPLLNPTNVMDYFSERSNPFYDRTCNNETIKMQRLSTEQLTNMTGLEYQLLHVQEPVLYVIRKQYRHSPTQVTPQTDYYIIAGVVYQAPDLASVLNSRLLSCVHYLQSSFEEASSYSRYYPSKGYSWDFKAQRLGAAALSTTDKLVKQKDTDKPKDESSTTFQRQRVDMLLGELVRKFPINVPQTKPGVAVQAPLKSETTQNGSATEKDVKPDIKQEKGMKPPSEKKFKIG